MAEPAEISALRGAETTAEDRTDAQHRRVDDAAAAIELWAVAGMMDPAVGHRGLPGVCWRPMEICGLSTPRGCERI